MSVAEGRTLDHAWTPDWERETQRARIEAAHAVARAADSIPRRVGEDADELERRTDRRISRRLRWNMRTAYAAWGGDPDELPAPDRDARRVASVLDWEVFAGEQLAEVDAALARVEANGAALGYGPESRRLAHRLRAEAEGYRRMGWEYGWWA